MTSFSDIDDVFFQQLHPLLSSKGMAITSKILKSLLKFSFKVDLDRDSRDDGTWNLQIPEINLPDHLRIIDKSILIFDDLERCNIDVGGVLGYINHFVEYQGLKVILIANEDKLLENGGYKDIKEKLIGKTFDIFLDFERAIENFIAVVRVPKASDFLSKKVEIVRDLFNRAECKNLRSLRQIILDFERIFNDIPEKAKDKTDILQAILQPLVAFSIEIRSGEMLPEDINKLEEEWNNWIGHNTTPNRLQNILKKYNVLELHRPFPSTSWWQTFFIQGLVGKEELEQSINNQYFQDENTPRWIKLWHISDISDDEFNPLIDAIQLELDQKVHTEIGIIKHIFGLLLVFSEAYLYSKSKKEILDYAKLYIDWLKNNRQLSVYPPSISESSFGNYLSLSFQGKEFDEFKELSAYIKESQKQAWLENLPIAAQNLADIMKDDTWKFYRMLCLNRAYLQNEVLLAQRHDEENYHQIPILKYIKPHIFVENLLSMTAAEQINVFGAISDRYNNSDLNQELLEELDWLKQIQDLLYFEVKKRKGKVSGFTLERNLKYYLEQAIEKLEEQA